MAVGELSNQFFIVIWVRELFKFSITVKIDTGITSPALHGQRNENNTANRRKMSTILNADDDDDDDIYDG